MDFDGIDLEDLANSEGPTFREDVAKVTNSEDQEGDETPTENEDGVDLDFLSEAGSVEKLTEDKQEVVKDIKVPSDKTAATSSSQTFTSLASALKEGGTFNSLSDEEVTNITDVTSLLEAFDKQVKSNEFANLNAIQKEYLEALAVGTPQEAFAQSKANADQYATITDETLEARPALQEELIKRSFLAKGFDLEKASKYATMAMKGDDPIEESKEARNSLVAYEEEKLQEDIRTRKQKQADAQAKSDKDLADLKSKITDATEVIPGIKVNSNTREKIFQSMITPTKISDGTPLNEVMEKYANDPEYKMKLHALDVITKGFKDFSSFVKASKTSAVKSLEDQLNNSAGNVINGSNMRSGTVTSTSQSEMARNLANLKL